MSDKDKTSKKSNWTCSICLETARDPAVTPCGHLFCWHCLYRWIQTNPTCPTCKGIVNEKEVIPIYGQSEKSNSNSNTNSNASANSNASSTEPTNHSNNSNQNPNSNDSVPDRPRGRRRAPSTSFPFTFFGNADDRFRYSQMTPQERFNEDFSMYLFGFQCMLVLMLVVGFL